MSMDNKNIVKRWFSSFWGNSWDVAEAETLCTSDIVVHHQMHGLKRGRKAVNQFMVNLREAFPDWQLDISANLIAEGSYVVSRWEGGGTHTGCAYSNFRLGSIAAGSGLKLHVTGITVFRLESWRIAEDLGQEDAITAMQQLGLLRLQPAEPYLGGVSRPLPHGWNRLASASALPRTKEAKGNVFTSSKINYDL